MGWPNACFCHQRSKVGRMSSSWWGKSMPCCETTSSSTLSSLRWKKVLLVVVALLQWTATGARAALLQGCDFSDDLCARGEVCLPDGLFGQCYSDDESALIRPLILQRTINGFQSDLLRAELTRLAQLGLDWPDARAQCVLAYFKLAVAFQLDYDTEFCTVRNPAVIWALVQRVQNALLAEAEVEKRAEDAEDEAESLLVDDRPLLTEEEPQKEEAAAAAQEAIEDEQRQPSPAEDEQAEDEADEVAVIPIVMLDEGGGRGGDDDDENGAPLRRHKVPYQILSAANVAQSGEPKKASKNDGRGKTDAEGGGVAQKRASAADGLSPAEEAELEQFMHGLLESRRPTAAAAATAEQHDTSVALNGRQLNRLVQFIRQLQGVLQNAEQTAEEEASLVEELQQEEAIPPPSAAQEEAVQQKETAAQQQEDEGQQPPPPAQQLDHVLLLKKDSEQFNNADMGLANTVHKIVKGGIQRVEGNRVYLKVAKEKLTEAELYKLIGYLDNKIAQPNSLYFDEFLYENGQLSFRISRLGGSDAMSQQQQQKDGDKKEGGAAGDAPTLENASGVAQAVYKRRKDIQSLAGIRVDETGIGSGQDVVPVERSQRDWLFVPIMAVSAMTICTLLAILATNFVRMRRSRRQQQQQDGGGGGPFMAAAHPSLLPGMDGGGGKAVGSALYDDLCRQRSAEEGGVSHRGVAGRTGGDRSKHSSTSSWPDDGAPSATGGGTNQQQLNISTGHVLLTFLTQHLEKPGEIAKEWQSVKDYANAAGETTVARRAENAPKNVDPTVLPYDDSLVTLNGFNSVNETLIDVHSSAADYYNASKIFDADPEPTYIVAQAPQANTVATFWQMAWEQGVALLVNLCDKDETVSGGRCAQYWPEEGSKVFGSFEVHLVSEHIWSEHYVVRSLYLKNNGTNETRTVTQFHFLSWPSGGMPESSKALLEFRRKVNKSYRGRASPVLVHCWNGAGRSGCYCLIDLVINRIQKGVKELNVAASLEHLRDQRMGMVANEEQFKLVFSCVAEEISARLKGLQQQQQQH